jgi:hypothetical protein
MFRWLSCGLVALVTLPLISAGPAPAPATQPGFVQAIRDMDRQLDQAQADLSAAKSELDELSKLPPIQPWHLEEVIPGVSEPRGKFDIRPYGSSFKFNGVTVYVEPVNATVVRGTVRISPQQQFAGSVEVLRSCEAR